jgi:hypothetical protein
MATKQDLEGLDTTILAVMCDRVANSTAEDENIRETALKLKHEWFTLAGASMPPTVKEYDEIKARLAALKSRMVDFLVLFV